MESVCESTIDRLLQELPEYLLDANHYYKNFRKYSYICHNELKVEYYIPIGSASQGSYYVATFAEHLLVTRVGLRATINRRIIDSVAFYIAILAGTNPYNCKNGSTVDDYLKIPPPVSREYNSMQAACESQQQCKEITKTKQVAFTEPNRPLESKICWQQ